MINKVQLSGNTAFRAKFHPYHDRKFNPEVLEKFERSTTKYPDFNLKQQSVSDTRWDMFSLYNGKNYLCSYPDLFTSKNGQAADDEVADRLINIFNKMVKIAYP